MIARSIKLSKVIFYALIICLPINLGLHFIMPSAYVGGLLVDYLIPTLFVQDILVFLLCMSWVLEDGNKLLTIFKEKKYFPILLLLYVLFLSTLLADRFVPSVYMFVRWVLYAVTALYVSKNFDSDKDLIFIIKTLSIWTIFLGVLALAQYLKQGSVFNNYLILGEQPYSAATPLIAREAIFGAKQVPAYGIFRHPNIFGGILAITLTWTLLGYRKKYITKRLFAYSYAWGLLALFLTFSYFSWIAFLLGTLFVLSTTSFKKFLATLFICFSLSGFIVHKLPLPQYLLENPSVYKRIDLLEAGYKATLAEKFVFGAGINSSTTVIENYLEPNNFLRFVQPPHNVFVLLLSEIGVIGVGMFIAVLGYALLNAYKTNEFIYIALLQAIFLSSFDHYFITVHQPFLLLWLLVGMALYKFSQPRTT